MRFFAYFSGSPSLLVSNLDDELPKGLPAAFGQIRLCLPRSSRCERVLLVHVDLHDATCDQLKEFGPVVERLVGRDKVVGRTASDMHLECIPISVETTHIRGSEELEVLLNQLQGWKGRNRPRRIANTDNGALPANELKIILEPVGTLLART